MYLIKSCEENKNAYAYLNNVVFDLNGIYFISYYGDPQYIKSISSALLQRRKNLQIVYDNESLMEKVQLNGKSYKLKTITLDQKVQMNIIYSNLIELGNEQNDREFVFMINQFENMSDILLQRIDQITNIPIHKEWKEYIKAIFENNNWLTKLDTLDSNIEAYHVIVPEDKVLLEYLEEIGVENLINLIPLEDIIDCEVENNLFEDVDEISDEEIISIDHSQENTENSILIVPPLNKNVSQFIINAVSPLFQKENGECLEYKSDYSGIMNLCISKQSTVSKGQIFRLAHYYTQNNDIMSDPEYDILITPYGKIFPITYGLSSLGIYQEVVEFGYNDDGEWDILTIKPKIYREFKDGITDWCYNLIEQFTIKNHSN